MFGYKNKEENSNQSIFAFLSVYAAKLHADAPSFEKHGHEASLWYQYDELHVVWMNGPL